MDSYRSQPRGGCLCRFVYFGKMQMGIINFTCSSHWDLLVGDQHLNFIWDSVLLLRTNLISVQSSLLLILHPLPRRVKDRRTQIRFWTGMRRTDKSLSLIMIGPSDPRRNFNTKSKLLTGDNRMKRKTRLDAIKVREEFHGFSLRCRLIPQANYGGFIIIIITLAKGAKGAPAASRSTAKA